MSAWRRTLSRNAVALHLVERHRAAGATRRGSACTSCRCRRGRGRCARGCRRCGAAAAARRPGSRSLLIRIAALSIARQPAGLDSRACARRAALTALAAALCAPQKSLARVLEPRRERELRALARLAVVVGGLDGIERDLAAIELRRSRTPPGRGPAARRGRTGPTAGGPGSPATRTRRCRRRRRRAGAAARRRARGRSTRRRRARARTSGRRASRARPSGRPRRRGRRRGPRARARARTRRT